MGRVLMAALCQWDRLIEKGFGEQAAINAIEKLRAQGVKI